MQYSSDPKPEPLFSVPTIAARPAIASVDRPPLVAPALTAAVTMDTVPPAPITPSERPPVDGPALLQVVRTGEVHLSTADHMPRRPVEEVTELAGRHWLRRSARTRQTELTG